MRGSAAAKSRPWLELLSQRLNGGALRRRCLSFCRVLAFAAALVPCRAHAETRLPRIDYAAPPSCPDSSRFVELVGQRVRAWPKRAEQQRLVAHVRVEAEGDGQREGDGESGEATGSAPFVGRLTLVDPSSGAPLGDREIREESCEEVVLALALFLAVALESETEDADVPSARPPESEPLATSRAARPGDAKTAAPPVVMAARGGTWNIVAGAHAVTGRTPEVAAGASAALELRSRIEWPVVPYAGLGVDLVPYSTASEGRGQIIFGWAALVGTACAAFERVRHRFLAGRWEPWVCARAEAGGLRAVSRGFDINQAKIRPWLAAGGELGIACWLSPDVAVTLGGGASLPFIRQAFIVNDARVYRSPAVTAELGVGLKLRAW